MKAEKACHNQMRKLSNGTENLQRREMQMHNSALEYYISTDKAHLSQMMKLSNGTQNQQNKETQMAKDLSRTSRPLARLGELCQGGGPAGSAGRQGATGTAMASSVPKVKALVKRYTRPDGGEAVILGRGSGWTKSRKCSRHATGLVGPPLFDNKPLAEAMAFGKDDSLSKTLTQIGRRPRHD
uniref:Uncharacterized protein n=1 Tax=Plectus sambesii TaxID=2011161 RepID=A0A914WXE4_9BILA